jgi:DNA polymerase-3 subunit delta
VRLSPESLGPALGRGLSSAYLVTGAESLLIAEACDVIRARARADGYGEREVHFVERGFDWAELAADTSNLSLFSNLRLIELKLSGTIDAEASKSLQALVERPPVDTVLLVSGTVERKALKNAWIAAFERAGVLVVTEPVTRRDIRLDHAASQVARRDHRCARGRARLRTASRQPARRAAGDRAYRAHDASGRVGVDEVGALVADSARYDVFELAAAAFSGQAGRALRILAGLRAEGEEPPLILWALLNDLRAVSRVAHRLETQRSIEDAMRAEQVWSHRQGPVRAALQRLRRPAIDALLVAAAQVDRLAKGSLRGDAWVALESLIARIAGVPLAA